ncbi:MAG: hypothetical protein NC402_00730 [Prevotella sp.]|nr:hypothetical protein [Prevotella sp.]MCM1074702.1 hypothetical protein [Ruminococcus sp.]
MRKTALYILISCVTFASFMLSASAPSPQKKLKQADKLVGNFAKISDARSLFKDVISDSVYSPDAHAYYIGFKIEREAFKHYYKLLSINRKDPTVDKSAMADALIDAYSYAMHCMALDSTINKKGNVEVKYSPELSAWLNENSSFLYNAGIAYMNKKLYFPKAYKAFTCFASFPEQTFYSPSNIINDSIRSTAYFYAGVMAYKSHKYKRAVEAFKEAEKHGYKKKELFLNQISCFSNLIKDDASLKDSLSLLITDAAEKGLNLYGVKTTPLFIQKYVAGKIYEEKQEFALAAIDTALVRNPDMLMLYTMKAGVYGTMKGKEKEAADLYIYAASDSTADPATLKSASKYLAQYGISLLDSVKERTKEARRRQKEIRTAYLQPALAFAQRGLAHLPEDAELLNTVETVTYKLH